MRQELINNNRPGTRISAQFVTVHNTGNPNSTSQNNRDYFANHPNAKVSAHWVVDDKEAIQCIPESEMAWHAGAEGNRGSIGVEVCEFTDPARHEQAYRNAVALCADILRRYGWGTDRLTTHKRWTGKECPRHILPVWGKFVADVDAMLGPAVIFEGKRYPAEIIDGATWTPVRVVAEAAGLRVNYDSKTRVTTLRR